MSRVLLLVALLLPALGETGPWAPVAIGFGLVSMVWGAIGALRHVDAKLILAWGTVSQLGLMIALLSLGNAKATFAGGCFWCMEPPVEQLEGVVEVVAGYTGGSEDDADYKKVSSGRTDHYEAVRVIYDPTKVSYKELVETFWRQIDPTDDGGQFADRGSHYRTAIF